MGHKPGIKDILYKLTEINSDGVNLLKAYYSDFTKHYYYEIAEFVYETERDDVAFVLEFLSSNKEFLSEVSSQIEKLEDHIKLELLRKNNAFQINSNSEERSMMILEEVIQQESSIKEMTKKTEENISNMRKELVDTKLLTEAFRKKVTSVEKDMKNHKFDVLALTTLIFTAFTVISINASIFGSTILKSVSIKSVIGMMAATNLVVILTVYVIYSIIRKIHGDINSKELNTNLLMAGLFLLFLSFVGLC